MDRPDNRKQPGDPLEWRADDFNRVARALEDFANLQGGGGIVISGGRGRRIIGHARPAATWAKLSGTGPAYTGLEQFWSSGWVDGSRTFGSVREVKGITGLANTIQFVEPSGIPDVWLFQAVKLGATVATLTCSPCVIPKTTLNVTYSYTNRSGGTSSVSTTLAFSSGTSTWSSTLTPITDQCGTSAGVTKWLLLGLRCFSFSGKINLTASLWNDSAGTSNFASCSGFTFNTANQNVNGTVTFSCSPFSIDWTNTTIPVDGCCSVRAILTQ